MPRLISIAAGVSPELAADPEAFIGAAADAGWPATGVWFDPDTWDDARTRRVADRLGSSGLAAVDMEVIRIGSDGDCGERLVDAAAEIGARNILAISSLADADATAERLAQLCQRAAPAGIRVCIEFMRFTEVGDLGDALDVAARTGEPNVGVLCDLLHVVRSGTTLDAIAAADHELFPYVQWCDAPAEPEGWSTRELVIDALDARSIPGEGQLPTAAFEALFADEVPFSMEVRSRHLREAFPDPTERAAQLLWGTRAALEQSAAE